MLVFLLCFEIFSLQTHVGLYMAKLLKMDEYKDCSLKNDAGECVSVHKIVLASRTKKEVSPLNLSANL